MKRIALITLASMVLFATAAAAHQNGWGNNQMRGNFHMQHAEYTGGDCPTSTNMMGWGIMTGPGMRGDATPGVQTNNWRTNPSYRGQVDDTTTTGK